MRLTALAALLLASAPAMASPALILGCGAHVSGPLTIRDAETGVVLLSIASRDALDTDCSVSDEPMVFDGPSHRAIITHR